MEAEENYFESCTLKTNDHYQSLFCVLNLKLFFEETPRRKLNHVTFMGITNGFIHCHRLYDFYRNPFILEHL